MREGSALERYSNLLNDDDAQAPSCDPSILVDAMYCPGQHGASKVTV